MILEDGMSIWVNDSNKPEKYLWENELGWLDMQWEIEILEKLLSLRS